MLRSVTDILGQLGSQLPLIPSVSCCTGSLPASHSVLKSVVTLAVVILRAYIHVTLLLLNKNPNSRDGNNFIAGYYYNYCVLLLIC